MLTRYTRYQAAVAAVELAPTGSLAPPNASLPFQLADLQVTYRNLGYGADIELCATAAYGAATQSGNCTATIAALNSTFAAQLADADLVWSWDRLLASYVALKHFDGPLFNVSVWVSMVRSPPPLRPIHSYS